MTSIRSKYNNDSEDDQVILNEYYNLHPKDIYVDTKSELFYTKFSVFQEIDIYNKNKQVVTSQGNRPFFVHALSGYLDELIISLGYKYDYNNRIKDKLFYEYVTEKLWKSVIGKYIIYFLIFLFLVYVLYNFKFLYKLFTKYVNNKKLFMIHLYNK